MRVLSILLTAMALMSATSLPAQKKPEKIKLDPGSKSGAVLMRVPIHPFPSTLQFSRNGKSGFLSRVYQMEMKPGASGFQYIARTLAPGRYRLDSIWQQGHWSVCLESGTFDFDIKPGEIAFVGTLRTDLLLKSLQQQAISAGSTTIRGMGYFLTHERTPAPTVEDRNETGLAAARSPRRR